MGHRGLVVRLLDACLGSAHACSVRSSDPLGVLDSRLGGGEPLGCLLHQISRASASPASGTVKFATPQPKVGPDSAHVPLGLVGRTDVWLGAASASKTCGWRSTTARTSRIDLTTTPTRLAWCSAFAGLGALHVAVRDNIEDDEIIVETAYRPDPALWEPDFKTRRKQP